MRLFAQTYILTEKRTNILLILFLLYYIKYVYS